MNSHRSISISVANERLQIKTDLPDGDIKEIVEYIDERYDSYARYNLEAGKRMALLALELGQQLFEMRKLLHQVKVERDELNNGIKEMAALLDEGLERPEKSDDWM